MNLKFKSISQKAIDSMIETSKNPFNGRGHAPSINNCEELICDITSHNYSHVVNSGNSAIMIAINSIDGPILIPNQGGGRGVKKIASVLNKDIIEEIRSRSDIVEIISSFGVQLKRSGGSSFKGLCPFHQEFSRRAPLVF